MKSENGSTYSFTRAIATKQSEAEEVWDILSQQREAVRQLQNLYHVIPWPRMSKSSNAVSRTYT